MMRVAMVAAGACLALAGCSDAGRTPTDVASGPVRMRASGSITVARAGGKTVAFPATAVTELKAGARVGSARANGAAVGAGGAVLPLALVRDDARGLIARAGEYRRIIAMRDRAGVVHHLVALYDSAGGPPRAIQHYVGDTLVQVLAMEWERVRGGWAQRRLHARELRRGRLLLETDARASTLHLASASRAERVRGRIATLLARAIMPRAAEAQYYFAECWDEYKAYWKATGALTTAIVAIEVAEETGAAAAVIEGLYVGYTAALASAALAEFDLFLCVENQRELEEHRSILGTSSSSTTSGDSWSSGTTSGGSVGEPVGFECLEGSYAAECQTAFTL